MVRQARKYATGFCCNAALWFSTNSIASDSHCFSLDRASDHDGLVRFDVRDVVDQADVRGRSRFAKRLSDGFRHSARGPEFARVCDQHPAVIARRPTGVAAARFHERHVGGFGDFGKCDGSQGRGPEDPGGHHGPFGQKILASHPSHDPSPSSLCFQCLHLGPPGPPGTASFHFFPDSLDHHRLLVFVEHLEEFVQKVHVGHNELRAFG